MRIEYRRVNIDTLSGRKRARKLWNEGRIIGSATPFGIVFYEIKKIPDKKSMKKVK